jgi:hypothetical protein
MNVYNLVELSGHNLNPTQGFCMDFLNLGKTVWFSKKIRRAPAQFDRGYEQRLKRQVLLCTQKMEQLSPFSKYRGFGVNSMKKRGYRMKMFITRSNAAS